MRTYTLRGTPPAEAPAAGSVTPAGRAESESVTPAGAPARVLPQPDYVPSAGDTAKLTSKEVQALAMLAARAFEEWKKRNPDTDYAVLGSTKKEQADTWRHAQVANATAGHRLGQRDQISRLVRGHYRTVAAHFFNMLPAHEAVAFRQLMMTGERAGKGLRKNGPKEADTHESADNARAVLWQNFTESKRSLYWLVVVIARKWRKADKQQLEEIKAGGWVCWRDNVTRWLCDATAGQIWQMVYSLRTVMQKEGKLKTTPKQRKVLNGLGIKIPKDKQ